MVDEKEDQYEGEEGEYHFSDDQINYDEVEAPKVTPASGSTKKSIFEKFSGLSPSRRMMLAGIVFMSLIGIVYKMLLPASPPSPEITQVTPTVKPSQPQITTAKPVLPAPPAASPSPPVVAPSVAPEVPLPPVVNAGAMQQTPPSTMPPTNPSGTAPVMPETAAASTAPTMPPQPLPPGPQGSNVADRVKAVEDHNTAIMNLLQTEYAQKMSEFEMQSNLVRGKIDEMAKRVNRIESSLNQITQMLQQSAPHANKQAASVESVASIIPARSSIPKVVYTVQAIIPGRAWLKADSGDTVTVAEGDVLRDYGRITKIDPYDGVVEIDTGNKIIALSYGMNPE